MTRDTATSAVDPTDTAPAYAVSWAGHPASPTRCALLPPRGDVARVRVGERELELSVEPLPDGSMIVISREDGGEPLRLHVTALEHERAVELLVRGRSWLLEARSERDTWLKGSGAAGGGGVLSVSMPGRVVKVLARVGDRVEAGHPVLIIEAMKMENEVKAGATGVVKVVHVTEGQSVEAGQVLIELHV